MFLASNCSTSSRASSAEGLFAAFGAAALAGAQIVAAFEAEIFFRANVGLPGFLAEQKDWNQSEEYACDQA